MRVLGITSKGWCGVEEAMNNILGVTSEMATTNLISMSHPPDVRLYRQQIIQFNPSVIIMGGYGPSFEFIFNTFRGKVFVVLWCSNILQSEISDEMNRLNSVIEMLKGRRIRSIAFIEKNSLQIMKTYHPSLNFSYFPIFSTPKEHCEKIEFKPKDAFHVDIFCTPNGRKNIYNQVAALHEFCKIHVNYDQGIYTKSFEHMRNVINHGRFKQHELFSYIKSMNLGVQASLNESYNYVVGDHLLLGVPVLSSMFVPAIAEIDDSLIKKYLIAQDVNDINEIKEKVMFLKNNPSLMAELSERCKTGFEACCASRKAEMKINLEKIIK